MSDWRKYQLNLTGAFRGAAEYIRLRKALPALQKEMPQGDGHPVLILPGFVADDKMMSPLRNFLRRKGYNAYAWEGGYNLGLTDKAAQHLRERLEEIFKENGNQKVTLIGHSLGGIYARELAREFPGMVRDVITVGSPFGAGVEKKSVPSTLKTVIEFLGNGALSMKDEDTAKRLLTPPSVPTTSIFSKEDGIAGWKACLNPSAPQTENIEVKASHIGLIWSAETFRIVMDRLAQPEGKWQSYKAPSRETPPANPNWKAGAGGGLFGKK